MSNNASFPDRQRAAPHLPSASFISPNAQMFTESADFNDFDLNQNDEFFPTQQPDIYADENREYRYDLLNSHQPHENSYDEQLASGWPLPEEPQHFGTHPPPLFDTNVALESSNGFENDYLYSSVGLDLPHDNGYPIPPPNQSDNGQAIDAGEEAEASRVVDATSNSLFNKEKQAKAVLKEQRNQTSAAKQMGKSVTISQTDTGTHIGGVYWTAPADDNTIPSSPTEINTCIATLTKAIQNRENCREKTTTGQHRNRWLAGSTYYSEDQFKAAARDLVLAMVEIHTKGWTKTIYDKSERENCQVTMFYTFEDRFEALCELLHCSKTTCQDILKGTRFYTIIGNPRTLTSRTATNKTANAHKAGLIAKGKVTSISEEQQANKSHTGLEERSDKRDLPEPTESLQPRKPPKGKKRAHDDILQAEGEASVDVPRPKVAAKKRRKA
ncbi:hypothetical protein GT037_007605 [Alternaria burnsii]|uniref:Uncharacterized protein n=1 Tax=Alternaria burnsii TaxID=1187904 RepID=A0A8H7ECP1_9PLEO|nr:uncharacterized protein GT037_007605 [Alternaria burnsii]KAF7674845.1 hypothetical protein GT037_007605 [Alternaria burnsii]